MNPLINIQGREAVPVRAIPLLTGWKKMTPDVLAKALAQNDYLNNFGGLTAHRLHPDGCITKTMPQEWSMLAMDLAGISDTIKAGQVSHDAGHMEWRKRATQALPAGVFVWRDEFAEQYEKSRYGNGTLSINRNLRAIGLEAVIPPLEFSIDVWPEREGLVFEGFGHVLAPVAVTAQAATSGIQPARASHAQNHPACFEWIEALAYWKAVKGGRSMYGESIAESPSGTDGTWPNALPLMMVADLQWRTSGSNADNRMTLVNLASALYGTLQRVVWTVPECYREPGNVVTMDAITAPQAKQIFAGMGVEPDRILKTWITQHCPNIIEPAPQPAPAAPPEAVLMPAQAVPVAVAESMPDIAHCLTTAQVATVFDGLHFSAENWRRRTSGTEWVQPAKRSAGERGGASAMWCPLALAKLIHARAKGVKENAATLKRLNSLFNRSDLLAPHRDAWGEFFRLMNND